MTICASVTVDLTGMMIRKVSSRLPAVTCERGWRYLAVLFSGLVWCSASNGPEKEPRVLSRTRYEGDIVFPKGDSPVLHCAYLLRTIFASLARGREKRKKFPSS